VRAYREHDTMNAPASGSSGADRGRVIGLSVLAVLLIAVVGVLATRGRASLTHPAPTAPASPPTRGQADAQRFRAEAWSLPGDATLGFVEIPEGSFVMGSDPTVDQSAYVNERWSETSRQGTVELRAFMIGRYEVTVAQFGAFVDATHYRSDPHALTGTADAPVVNVSWTDALAYAHWLDTQLRNSATTPAAISERLRAGWRVTLPSEAQWEKAARGTDGRVFPWGNEPDRGHANFGGTELMPVGSFGCANCVYGLADMIGNAWELTRSPYQLYPFDDTDDEADLHADALYVMRGGAFGEPANNARAAVRGGIDPGARRPFIGFRLVISLPNSAR
jgi:formylglycine-generating enzyme required for sulfatase activity